MADGAARMLGLAVRLLPAARQDWGQAMRAELATVPPGSARWRFVAGCLRVTLTQSGTAYPAAVVAFLAGVVVGTSSVAYLPLRVGLVLMAMLFVGVSYAGRRAPQLGPVAADPVARVVRGAGYVLVGTAGVFAFLHMRNTTGPQPDPAFTSVPILTVALALYLLAFLAATGRHAAARPATLTVGGLVGIGVAGTWTLAVISQAPIPDDANGALVLILAGFGAAALARSSDGRQAMLAGLLASTTAALLIWLSVHFMTTFGPDSWIPALVPVALTPASRVSESRIEVTDPYMAIVFLGDLLAALLSATALVRPTRAASPAHAEVAPG